MTNISLPSKQLQWLADKSEARTLCDGTVSYYFRGTLPPRMVMELHRYIKDNNGVMHTNPDISVRVRFGKKMSTQNTVTFCMDDFRVPAENEKRAIDDFNALMAYMM